MFGLIFSRNFIWRKRKKPRWFLWNCSGKLLIKDHSFKGNRFLINCWELLRLSMNGRGNFSNSPTQMLLVKCYTRKLLSVYQYIMFTKRTKQIRKVTISHCDCKTPYTSKASSCTTFRITCLTYFIHLNSTTMYLLRVSATLHVMITDKNQKKKKEWT